MADELSPLDYLLHRGEAYPATRSAFLNLEILDGPADWGRLREAMDRASRVVIRMRQRVVVPPLPTTPPRWVVDPDFDLDYHLRRVALPAPGTLRQLLDLAEVTLQSPLDTSRALWEAVYVEGLEGGRSALLTKLSHAITDGLGGIALFEQIYDTERNPEPRPMPPVPVPRDVSGGDLLRDSIRNLPQTTFSAGRRFLGGVASAAVLGVPLGNGQAEKNPFAHHKVGEVVDGKLLVADNQWIAPPSDTKRVEFSDQDALGGAISPNGRSTASHRWLSWVTSSSPEAIA